MNYIKTADGWKPWLPSVAVSGNSNSLEGVFKETSLEQARVQTGRHADHFTNCVNRFMNGGYSGSGSERYRAMWDNIRAYPLHGAFGEKL